MRTIIIFVLVFATSLSVPVPALALTANDEYCETSSECESGYCYPIGDWGGICATNPNPDPGATGATGATDTGDWWYGDTTSGSGSGNSGNSSGNGNSSGSNGNGSSGTGVALINPLQSGASVESFLQNILDFVIRIGSVVVILMMVFVGFKFVTAQGNDTKITEAKTMLLWTIIGALILLGAKVLASGIQMTVQALGG